MMSCFIHRNPGSRLGTRDLGSAPAILQPEFFQAGNFQPGFSEPGSAPIPGTSFDSTENAEHKKENITFMSVSRDSHVGRDPNYLYGRNVKAIS